MAEDNQKRDSAHEPTTNPDEGLPHPVGGVVTKSDEGE
jgi:hypothetical protein